MYVHKHAPRTAWNGMDNFTNASHFKAMELFVHHGASFDHSFSQKVIR